MNKNEYGEIINGEKTYKGIAEILYNSQNVIIGWDDEEYTHYDILFSYRVFKPISNILQRGLRGNELYVSIIGIGAFGFDINKNDTHQNYYNQKLNITGNNDKIADLINNIRKELCKLENGNI